MHLGWAFISMAVLLWEEGYEHRHRCSVPRRNVTWRYTEEMAVCKDRKRGPRPTVLVPWPRNSSKDPLWDVISFVDLILVALENLHRVQRGQRALCWKGCALAMLPCGWQHQVSPGCSAESSLHVTRRHLCQNKLVEKKRTQGLHSCKMRNWGAPSHTFLCFLLVRSESFWPVPNLWTLLFVYELV